jgi:L-lactate utilization protein LutB
MMMASIQTEYILDGSSNFNNWKARIRAILEENNLDQYVTTVVAEPTSTAGRVSFKRNQAKARRIIYDYVKKHIMPIITPLKIANECYDTLVKLYETKATH